MGIWDYGIMGIWNWERALSRVAGWAGVAQPRRAKPRREFIRACPTYSTKAGLLLCLAGPSLPPLARDEVPKYFRSAGPPVRRSAGPPVRRSAGPPLDQPLPSHPADLIKPLLVHRQDLG